MNQLKDLPDLARPFALMKLNDRLRMVSERTIFGSSIQTALHSRPMDRQLLEEIWSQYVDNQEMVIGIVGEEAILLIAEILHK